MPPPRKIPTPQAGKPGGTAARFLRVDILQNLEEGSWWEDFIETKCPRLAWARAAVCSCSGFGGETGQPDNQCPVCSGKGYRYFKPQSYVFSESVAALGEFSPLQQRILEESHAVPIRGWMAGLSSDPTIYQAMGPTASGSTLLTVRPGNRLGYYDRITSIDEVSVFSEIVEVEAGLPLSLRYPPLQIELCSSLDKVFVEDEDFSLVDGVVAFFPNREPAPGTRLSMFYLYNPVWVVQEFPNLFRSSLVSKKIANPETPEGTLVALPMRAMLRLEYLPTPPKGPEPS